MLVRLYRLSRFLIHIVYGCFYVGALFHFMSSERRFAAIQKWSRQALGMLNIRWKVIGAVAPDALPTLVVSNHVSWLDIWVINCVTPVRFVAKSDIRRWPVVGFLVTGAGTIFIEREKRRDTARTNRAVIEALMSGDHVAVFPEGTTTDGTEVKSYHASLFQPALGAGARVVVLALRYLTPDGHVNIGASYVGDQSLLESVRLILGQRSLDVEVIVAGTVDVSGKTRRQIAREAEVATADALSLPRPDKRPGTAADPLDATPTTGGPISSRNQAQRDSSESASPARTSGRR